MYTVVALAEQCFTRGGRVADFVQLVIDMCGVDIVSIVNDKGLWPLELLMKKLVCIKFCHFILLFLFIIYRPIRVT